MGADSVLKMAKNVATWEFPALQRVVKLSARASPRNSPKRSARAAPVSAPQVPRSPRKVAAELSVLMLKLESDFKSVDGDEERDKWKCFLRETSLIEAWLDRMLQKTELTVEQYRCRVEKGDTVRGLQEYGLSRAQLGIVGLSELQIDRAYRMLYVYSVGCNEMIKALCLHSLEKAMLVGSFWRAFIRLCEEHSKVELQAEIAELVMEKQNAIDELRLTRGCLNEALDGLALNKLLTSENWEATNDPQPTSTDDGQVYLTELVRLTYMQQPGNLNPKSGEHELFVLTTKCEHLNKEREELQIQLNEASRLLRMEHSALNISNAKEREKAGKLAQLEEKLLQAKTATEREKIEAQKLREICKKLEHDVEETERKTMDMTWKFVQYERDFPILQKEVAENKHRARMLETVNQHVEQECSILKHRVEHQDAAISRLQKQLETYEKAVKSLKEEAKERSRLFEDKAREALLNGEEVEAWINGHESLLEQQRSLFVRTESLKHQLQVEQIERTKERQNLESKVRIQQGYLRALAVGIASLTPRRLVTTPKQSLLSEVSIEPEQSRAERRLSRRLSRKMSRRGTELGRRASEFLKLQYPSEKAIAEDGDVSEVSEHNLDSEDEWDDLCSELSQQREEIEKLEANLKEERDRRLWMERHVGEAVKEVERLQFEADQTSMRVTNLALEKKNKEKYLQIAEEQIRKLNRQVESMLLVAEKKNAEVESITNLMAINLEKHARSASLCKQHLVAGAKLLEDSVASKMDTMNRKFTSLMEILRVLRKDASKTGTELKSWKQKKKTIEVQHAVLLSEMKTLKSEFESASTENVGLGFKLQKEEQARTKAEEELSKLTKFTANVKLDQAVLEVQLESTLNKNMQMEVEKASIEAKLAECMGNVNSLRSQKEKEDAIRGILQSDVDALRLEVEGLKRQISIYRGK